MSPRRRAEGAPAPIYGKNTIVVNLSSNPWFFFVDTSFRVVDFRYCI